ncbi:unnamed protein product [Echinostoma caproni]|uniref:Recombinase n=1 Tax=Echinostoma caproni TaxID=27848 RepID=A0A183AVB8_9TREM|nr:unnamed protein product [Echinostoma caproni]
MDLRNLRTRASELVRDAPKGASVEHYWILIKEALVDLQNEFALLKPSRRIDKPLWWRAAIAKAIKQQNRIRTIMETGSYDSGEKLKMGEAEEEFREVEP